MSTVRKLYHLNARERKPVKPPPGIIPADHVALANVLPAGGWPQRGLVEIMVPAEATEVMSLLTPALARLSRQDRWLGMVAPPYLPRASILSFPGMDVSRILQINQHASRSGLWTVEQLLQSGICSVVMAWPACDTELMATRLQQAAVAGNTLGILFRIARFCRRVSRTGLLLVLEEDAEGRVVYRLDDHGNRVAGVALERRSADLSARAPEPGCGGRNILRSP
jgi:cell division inhibitor SulA